MNIASVLIDITFPFIYLSAGSLSASYLGDFLSFANVFILFLLLEPLSLLITYLYQKEIFNNLNSCFSSLCG